MSADFILQLALYELFDIVPFVILAVIPFRAKIRSRPIIILFTAMLYLLGFVKRTVSFFFPASACVFSLLWVVIYLILYRCSIRERLSKLLFVMITVLNYASMTAILYNYVGFHIFGNWYWQGPYCIEVSISIVLVLAVTYPVMFWWLLYRVSPVLEKPESIDVWKKPWLAPVTFGVIYYYSLYSSDSIFIFSSEAHNLFFSLAVSAGLFFVLTLILQFVEASALTIQLQSEKHQMEMNLVHFQSLSEQIEAVRQASHDQRQLIHVLQIYLKEDNLDCLHSFAEKICCANLEVPVLIYCRHMALNALICYYADLCAKKRIDFSVQMKFPAQTGVDDVDLIVLFGNLLENAYEACSRQKSQNRFIHLKTGITGSQVVILLNNSFDGRIKTDGEFFLSAKHPGHGTGTASVRRIILKYQGTVKFDFDDTVFRVSARLNG